MLNLFLIYEYEYIYSLPFSSMEFALSFLNTYNESEINKNG